MILKDRLMARNSREERANVAERIAHAILDAAPRPHEPACETAACSRCICHRQAQADAAIARKIGGAE